MAIVGIRGEISKGMVSPRANRLSPEGLGPSDIYVMVCCSPPPLQRGREKEGYLPCFFHPDSGLSGVRASRIRYPGGKSTRGTGCTYLAVEGTMTLSGYAYVTARWPLTRGP